MNFAIASGTVRRHISLGASVSVKHSVVTSPCEPPAFTRTVLGRQRFLARGSRLLADRRLCISATSSTAAGQCALSNDLDQLSVTVAAWRCCNVTIPTVLPGSQSSTDF